MLILSNLVVKFKVYNFNPIKDELYSMLEDATDEELILYRNVIETIKTSQRLTTKERQEIKKTATAKQKELTVKKKR